MNAKKKILIIRFSSFGDIIQSLSSVDLIKEMYPISEVHFVTKAEFFSIVRLHSDVDKIFSLKKSEGVRGLLKLMKEIRTHDYEVVYDAHESLRSKFLVKFLFTNFINYSCGKLSEPVIVKRKKYRLKRFMLFYMKKNLYPWPFVGRISYQAPLLDLIKSRALIKKIDLNFNEIDLKNVYPEKCHKLDKTTITIAPSATRDMKKWPLQHWLSLVSDMKDYTFIILGGPEDTYLKEFEEKFGERVINFAGKLSLVESCYLVSRSNVLICADSGLMHVGDYAGVPTIALIGPTAFGFPAAKTTITLEVPLKCRPCTKDGRGKCSQDTYQKCLADITPEIVKNEVLKILN